MSENGQYDFKEGDRCPVCGRGNLCKCEITETLTYREETLVISGCVVYRCFSCGHGFYDRETTDRVGSEAKKLIAGVKHGVNHPGIGGE